MPSFKICYPIIKESEGGWVLDPDDPGEETFRGVTRRDWGWLSMWAVIDKCKPDGMTLDPKLLTTADWIIIDKDCWFVAENGYWNRMRGNNLINQSLANMLVDSAYLNGVHQASIFLQRGLNKLNMQGTLFPNMVKDGGIGRITLSGLKAVALKGNLKRLHHLIKAYRIVFYSELMEASEKREKYQGWIDRAARFQFKEEALAA